MFRLKCVLVIGALALSLAHANAIPLLGSQVDFDWTESLESGSGTFITTFEGGGVYLITGITGTVDGQTITGLISPGGFNSNDNLLYYPPAPQLDATGVAFVIAGEDWDMSFNFISDTYLITHGDRTVINDEFSASPAAPLPFSLPLFATGLGGLGLLGWLRKRKPVAA